jgi:hypothetical protein
MYGLLRSYRPADETFFGERFFERFADHRIIESAANVTLTAFIAAMERVVELMGWSYLKITSFKGMAYSVITSGPR